MNISGVDRLRGTDRKIDGQIAKAKYARNISKHITHSMCLKQKRKSVTQYNVYLVKRNVTLRIKQDGKSRLQLANKTNGTVNAKLNYIILTSVANHFP